MMYAGFEFYQKDYLGTLIKEEKAFARLSKRASECLDFFTFNRIDRENVSESVRLAVCSMAEVLFWIEKRKQDHDGREIASESNDGYSVSFASANEADMAVNSRTELYLSAYKYLAYTGLMDFGVET